MSSLFTLRRHAGQWHAPDLSRALARIADRLHVAVCAVDDALRAELEAIEANLVGTLKANPNIRLPEHPYCCKDPHLRIRHDHALLCVEAPRLAGSVGELAFGLAMPTAPELSIPAFDERSDPRRAPQMIDVNGSYAAIVREARARGWTSFEDGSAPVLSVASALMGSPCPVGQALLALSKIQETDSRMAVRELADTLYFAGSRLRWIANHVVDSSEPAGVVTSTAQSFVGRLKELQASLQCLDARIRDVCLFDPTPRGQHLRDIVYQEVVTALADGGFDPAGIARLIVLKKPRDLGLWQRRVDQHVRSADQDGIGLPSIDRLATSFDLGARSDLKTWRRLS